MIDAGATVVRELENTPSARNMINRLHENAQPTSTLIAVEIQSEIVDSLKLVRDMNAGKRLKSTLKVLTLQKKLAEAGNDVEARNKYSETVKN